MRTLLSVGRGRSDADRGCRGLSHHGPLEAVYDPSEVRTLVSSRPVGDAATVTSSGAGNPSGDCLHGAETRDLV